MRSTIGNRDVNAQNVTCSSMERERADLATCCIVKLTIVCKHTINDIVFILLSLNRATIVLPSISHAAMRFSFCIWASRRLFNPQATKEVGGGCHPP